MDQKRAVQTRYLRLRSQGLLPEDGAAAGDTAHAVGHVVGRLVGRLVGVQAQEAEGAVLSVGIRHRGLTAAQVEAARLEARSVVRTWALRGTLHLVAAADLGWLLPLLAPGVIRQRRRRYAELGLGEEQYVQAARLMETALRRQGPMIRAELGAYLAGQGGPLEGQALYHALGRAGLEGLLCYGPDRAGVETYVSLDRWATPGPPRPEEDALAELARRYLLAYGPARAEDLAAWSGLPLGRVRAALEHLGQDLVAVDVGGGEAWLHGSRRGWLDEPVREDGIVRLLPAYDPYLLGYRGRDHVVSAQYARRIHPGGGFLRPTVIVDGWAAGTWKLARKAGAIEVTVEPFEPLGRPVREALEAEVGILGRFYGGTGSLRILE